MSNEPFQFHAQAHFVDSPVGSLSILELPSPEHDGKHFLCTEFTPGERMIVMSETEFKDCLRESLREALADRSVSVAKISVTDS